MRSVLILAATLAAGDAGTAQIPAVEQPGARTAVEGIVVFRSADGSFGRARLAAKRLEEVVAMHALDGRNATDLALSPDGRVLAYTTAGARGRSTELFDLQAGSTTQLVPPSTGESYGPRWLQDGLRVSVNVHDGRSRDIALVNRYGGALRRLHLERH